MNGLHLTADLYDCAARHLLVDETALASLCRHQVSAVDLHIVGERWHRFRDTPAGPGGITGVLLLAESHLAIHTWPEKGAVTLDIYVCNFGADNSSRAEALLHALQAAFAPVTQQQHRLVRGVPAAS
jgi:S-adenosylmethionine decarboxylase proenzyme